MQLLRHSFNRTHSHSPLPREGVHCPSRWEGACTAMVSDTDFSSFSFSSTAASPPPTTDAIAGVLSRAAVAGAAALSTEYCRIPETCSTYMSRDHAIVSKTMSSLIKDAYLGETRKILASPALFG